MRMTSSVFAVYRKNTDVSLDFGFVKKMRFKQINPMKTTARYRPYSPTAMYNAYRAVLEQSVPVKRAAFNHGVPENTLRQRVLGRVNPETTSSGPSPTLTQEEEAILVEHLKSMATLGYGYTTKEVICMASNYAVFLNKRDRDHPFSTKWFRCFMRRWPELSVNKPRALSKYRAQAASEETVTKYFENLDKVLTKFQLKDKPQCIYNVDEKGLQTEHSPPFVVSGSSSTPGITASRSAITTVIGCGNALGSMIPPYFVFKGKRFRNDLIEDCSTGTAGTVSDSGWSNSGVFQEFLEDHFIKYVQRDSPDQRVLLIFDGHKSHVNVPSIRWAEAHNIELFVLPAHTSHLLQPLDVGCFGPLQRIYNHECHKFIRNNPSSRVTRYNVAPLASKAYDNALSPGNLRASFKRTGIFPFDPSVITPSQLAPASAYIMPLGGSVTPTEDVPVDSSQPAAFFSQQSDCIKQKQTTETKATSTTTKENIVSGQCITEPETVKILEQQHEQRKSKEKKPTKGESKSSGKKKVNKKKVPSREEIAGPSGVQMSKSVHIDSDSDESVAENEKCCQCHRFQPVELKQCVSLIFTKWAQCEFPNCLHWTHLEFCCKEKFVRRHGTFICPCHSEE